MPVSRSSPWGPKKVGMNAARSSGPATRPVAEFTVDIPRPRDVTEIVQSPQYLDLHRRIWDILKKEVLKSYERGKTMDAA